MGNAHEYRRHPITLRHCVLDDELRPIDEPEVIWAGLMDQVKLKTSDSKQEGNQIVLRCELPDRDGRAAHGLRLNHAQQLQRAPDDYGLSRIERLSALPQPWLMVRFQRIWAMPPITPMQSLADWPRRLDALCQQHLAMPFAWGTTDCPSFAAEAVQAQHGCDAAARAAAGTARRASRVATSAAARRWPSRTST